MSTFGVVSVQEQLWRQQMKIVRPFCDQAKVANRSCSRRLERAMTDFAADDAFATAAAKLKEHYGVEVTHERIRQVCLKHAKLINPKVPTLYTILPSVGADYLIAEADGTMLPVVDTSQAPANADRRKHRKVSWKEVKVVVAQSVGKVKTHYDATLGDVHETAARWSQVAAEASWGANTHIHVVADGAPWIAQQAKVCFGSHGHYLLDLYHVCDYIAPVWPEDKTTQQSHRDALKAGQITSVLDAIRERIEPIETPDEEAPARIALRYLENRLDQLDYAGALKAKLPVGSGLIESTHRHLLQARLKLSGAWWELSNLKAMIQLRVYRANEKWDAYWRN
jgi:hypothetical protein